MKNITFCLMTCGEQTEQECLEAIEPYRDQIFYQEVRNVTPACEALNQMIRQCETEFLVPLDADMILYPGSYERICKAIQRHSQNSLNMWHSILFPLWDTLTQEKIMALKVFRSSIVKKHPYRDDNCPDIEHYQRLENNGYVVINYMNEDPIGDHVVKGNFFCYAKYRDLYMTMRTHPSDILESHFKGGSTFRDRAINHANFFYERYQTLGHQEGKQYLYCLGGMLEGLTGKATYRSKDLSQREMKYEASIESGNISDVWDEWLENDKRHRIFA